MVRLSLSISFFGFLVASGSFANVPAPASQIDEEAQAILPKVIEWRRHIHQYPELSNREVKTAKYVSDHLKALGLDVRTGIAKTGVLGILKGSQPGPVIALRADMDALPVQERNALPFASKEKGTYNGETVNVMHACGHDAHVAMLMGTASVLTKMRDKIKGAVVFIFQPAEEGAPIGEEGGASLMVKEGVLDNPKVDAIFGIHISSVLEVGKIRYVPGAAYAASNVLNIKVKGKQSHGAAPWNGVDPVVTGAQIILGLQTVVSRQSDITKTPVIVTIGKINAGVRNNIIPDELTMLGTIRSLDNDTHKDVMQRVKRTAEKIAESAGATAEVSFGDGNPVVFNNLDLVQRTLPSLLKSAGSENVALMEPITGAEDFAYYGLKVPAFYFQVGGMPKGQDPKTAPSHHSPDFFIDDSRLDVGVKAFTNIVFDYVSPAQK